MTEKKNSVTKRSFVLLIACIFCSSLLFTACADKSTEKAAGAAKTDASPEEVTQADIEEKIIGNWMVTDREGQPALTNEKGVFTFVSPTKGYVSASFNSNQDKSTYWGTKQEMEVSINGNVVTLTSHINDRTTIIDELTISSITDNETQGTFIAKAINDGEEAVITEESIRLVKVNKDLSEDIIGTWEGRCTSEGSVFDDGQEHRWEYKSDGTYVYYEKDGDNWVPGDDTTNEYFVAGNLLCTRWIENGEEYREWWEITIDGDKMSWTALREGEDGKTFTASFEMKKAEV